MLEELICPDCGGVIGGEPNTGRSVCRCFEDRKPAKAAASDDLPPAAIPDPVTDVSTSGQKLCRVCGKDLKGHRRLRDSRGYVCVACDAEERRMQEIADAQDLSLIPCPECGRKLKAEGIVTVGGLVMCKRCAAENKELNKYRPVPLVVETGKAAEKQKLQWLLIVLGVLVLIMLLSWMGVIGG